MAFDVSAWVLPPSSLTKYAYHTIHFMVASYFINWVLSLYLPLQNLRVLRVMIQQLVIAIFIILTSQ